MTLVGFDEKVRLARTFFCRTGVPDHARIRLPDGSFSEFAEPVSIAAIAQSIGPGLAKAALAGRVNGTLVDTSHVVGTDADVAIVD